MSDRQVAVVTGSGSGIGRAVAVQLAADGYFVVSTDVSEQTAAETSSLVEGLSFKLDVTDTDSCRQLAATVASSLGRLDVWVSNAGVSRMKKFLEIEEQDFDRTLNVNLRGVFFASQAAARVMMKQGQGSIVNVASMAGKQGRVPFLSDYVASKFGVVGLTQAMAFELAATGIRVNSVCPGYVATPMQERELVWEAALRGSDVKSVEASWVADTPMGRLESPEDVALAVSFLVSEKARFITGESLSVNGGAFMD
jgi:NAD(P)-dependent dehydrogenase (short-subunit alcohol dehydrogenase family)